SRSSRWRLFDDCALVWGEMSIAVVNGVGETADGVSAAGLFAVFGGVHVGLGFAAFRLEPFDEVHDRRAVFDV
ncbi:MAG: hypothetical protein KJN60_14075, partial [Boseongicola sp.]|nr:hypothetical protein [Boseongicola sp.]